MPSAGDSTAPVAGNEERKGASASSPKRVRRCALFHEGSAIRTLAGFISLTRFHYTRVPEATRKSPRPGSFAALVTIEHARRGARIARRQAARVVLADVDGGAPVQAPHGVDDRQPLRERPLVRASV